MRVRFMPQDAVFFDLLKDLARELSDAHLVLAELSGVRTQERPAALARMEEVSARADETTHAVLRALRENYVTPLDRQDIFMLADSMRETCHSLEAVARAMATDAFDEMPPGTTEILAVLGHQGELTAAMAGNLRALRELWEYHDQINRQAHQAQWLYQRMVETAREKASARDVPRALASSQLAAVMLQASHAYRHVGVAVGRIVVKES